jgi:predicted O-linked N-acetylglucosamine transferase (SPINDLY family)
MLSRWHDAMAGFASGGKDLFSQALACFQAGDLPRAKQILASVLAGQPKHFDALHLLGVITAIAGANEEAEALYKKALRINGNRAELRLNLTLAQLALRKYEEALVNIDHALDLDGRNPGAHITRGNILRHLKRNDEAVASFDDALAIDPGHAKAWTNRGVALGELGRHGEALASHDKALGLDPSAAEAWSNRGIVLARFRRYDEALDSYDRALAINPASAATWSNRGNVLGELKRHDEALASFDKALAIDPASAEFWSNRGNVLGESKRYDEALASFEHAIAIDPGDAELWCNRGLAYNELERHAEALDSFDRALNIDAGTEYCLGNWVIAKLMLCDWQGIATGFETLREKVDAGARASNPFSFLAAPASPAQQRRCAEIYVRANFAGAALPLYTGEKYAHDRMRLAYLSGDFHDHATAYLMAGLFETHDRARFETTAISYGPDAGGAMRARLTAAFDRFIDVRSKSDREVALLLRQMEIDIAVDLKGYTREGRPGILAHRPAPLQINYLGYPGTQARTTWITSLPTGNVIPEEHKAHYSEKIIYLPHTYQVNDARRAIAAHTPTRAECGLPEAGFVFCCFNNAYKITPEVFSVWMRLLRRIPGSVLWLLEAGSRTADNLRREAGLRDVAPERLVFAPRMKLEEHLARHKIADLFLDTLPYNAHTTASDALWAGLPVLTCTGAAFSGRVASGLLHAIGLPELIAESLDEYEERALELACQSSRMAVLRDKLARNRLACPLFDTALFARHLESAYITARERQQSGLPPDHIYVES